MQDITNILLFALMLLIIIGLVTGGITINIV